MRGACAVDGAIRNEGPDALLRVSGGLHSWMAVRRCRGQSRLVAEKVLRMYGRYHDRIDVVRLGAMYQVLRIDSAHPRLACVNFFLAAEDQAAPVYVEYLTLSTSDAD